jgi:hypothetical protein
MAEVTVQTEDMDDDEVEKQRRRVSQDGGES